MDAAHDLRTPTLETAAVAHVLGKSPDAFRQMLNDRSLANAIRPTDGAGRVGVRRWSVLDAARLRATAMLMGLSPAERKQFYDAILDDWLIAAANGEPIFLLAGTDAEGKRQLGIAGKLHTLKGAPPEIRNLATIDRTRWNLGQCFFALPGGFQAISLTDVMRQVSAAVETLNATEPEGE